MTGAELPLYGLFEALRDSGLPLGVGDYLALLSALRLGEGADRPALLRLCCMLWTSLVEEAAMLTQRFEELAGRPMGEGDVLPEEAETASSAAESSGVPERSPPASALSTTDVPETASATAPASLRAMAIAAATVQGSTANLDLAMSPRRLSVGEYLPVTARQLGQSWRRLRRMEARGPMTELDVPGTITESARAGMWTMPLLAARPLNVARLLLLVDRHGSMTPFHPLTQRVVESAAHGSNLGRVDVVYFHNYAVELVDGKRGSMVLQELLAKTPVSTGALLLSDAGAARGQYSTERVDGTRRMLARLSKRLGKIAWINPVPRSRWPGTSAQDICDMVPMFEANRNGFDAALRVLRGRRPIPHGASPWSRP